MPEDTLDPNKLAAEVVVQATTLAIKSVAEPLQTKVRRVLQRVLNAYQPYLEKTFARVKSIRTFLKPSESIDLLQNYIAVGLTDGQANIDVDTAIKRLKDGDRLIVSGLAGRGKSVLMKFIALSFYHTPQGRIPLFLELRALNSLSTKNILQLIHSQYAGSTNVRFSDFQTALRQGYFLLVLDGFDEVSPADRDNIERQIIEMAVTYDRLPIVVSGRYYERFSSWERFTHLQLLPMSYKQTRSLISNSQYDDDVRKTFLKRLTNEFFKKHESFLNTPLLAIMLMLTFEEYAEIPLSLHEFYRNAFDTLIRRHDAMKAQFLRVTHSGCTAEGFKRLFSAFCLLSYSKSAFTFTRDQILEYLTLTIRQQQMNFEPEAVLKDLIESICLLQEEGFEISFVHRSFQEYFCALFVCNAGEGLIENYLNSGKFRTNDDVLPMLFGMNPDRVEREWAIEAVNSIRISFPRSDPDHKWKYAINLFPSIEIILNNRSVVSVMLSDGPLYKKVDVLRRLYPAHFEFTRQRKSPTDQEQKDWRKKVTDELRKLEADGEPQLKGAGAAIDQVILSTTATKSFYVNLTSDFKTLINAMYADNVARDLLALQSISEDQKAREKGSDDFLSEVFAL